MAGACLAKSPPLQVPDLKGLQGLKAVRGAQQELLQRREAGQLGALQTAQRALDYAAACAYSAQALAQEGEAWEHVGILTAPGRPCLRSQWLEDVLHFFPNCGPIHLWVLEALMSLLRHEGQADTLARPVFDSVTDLISLHLEDPTLRSAVPELPRRLLAALALAITPDSVKRLTQTHAPWSSRVWISCISVALAARFEAPHGRF